ncbi:hypothetical protein AB0E96_13995 [Kitasatospora sp. NPDC036755]|uniref:hypothetical protein n=1 Tax=Kitasatospora sp. NPDC036755 TaxID=3154600 RepID=UPI0033C108AC
MAAGSTGASDRAGGEPVLKPRELRGEGREFEKLGGDPAKAATALERGLAALGAPWGTDRPRTSTNTAAPPLVRARIA